MINKENTVRIAKHLLSIITCALMLMAVVIQRDGRLYGYNLVPEETKDDAVLTHNPDGTILINTSLLSSEIKGYGGPVPLAVTLRGGRVVSVQALPNSETPSFFAKVKPLMAQWVGLTPADILSKQVDAVSGATYSSGAVIASMHLGMEYAMNNGIVSPTSYWQFDKWLSPQFIASLIVILMGMIVPLFFKNKIYRLIQLVLNVVVLGFWSGTFLNYTMLLNFFSNGINLVASFIVFLLFIVAFIYPLFGKKNHYCLWVCPFGSLQELAGKTVKYRLPMSPKLIKVLDVTRQVMWAVLMLLMWTGVYFSWIDYELFTAFMFNQAALPVIVVALLFVLLSTVVSRPYCRFVCPTGCLVHTAHNEK